MELIAFSKEINSLFQNFTVPQRLYAHLMIVHDVANKLLEEINRTWENLNINKNLVLSGLQLLLSLGISEEKSKFAASHSSWSENSALEELLVSLADKIWKGNRVQDLLIQRISTETKTERWEVFSLLDSIIDDIAKDADKRLSFQNNLSTTWGTT